MADILIKAGSYIAIILLGIVLRRVGFFKKEDFNVLVKIVIRITLPAAIIVSTAGRQISISMLSIVAIALCGGVINMTLGYLMNRKGTPSQKAFGLLNMTGYNIGNFTLPFVQSFLGPTGVIVTSLFDTGNSLICLGGAFSVASMIKDGTKFSVKRILNSLMRSVPFLFYIVMTTLTLSGITLPKPVIDLAQIIANANAFLAMLMLGIGFKLSGNASQIGDIVRILLVRYGFAAVFAAVIWFVLPFPTDVKLPLVILAFSPIGSAVPAFTEEMKGDVGLSSAINSISIIISIVIIVTLLTVLL
jgi:predicted permease